MSDKKLTEPERLVSFVKECDRMKIAGILAIKSGDAEHAEQARAAAGRALSHLPQRKRRRA